MAAILQNTQRRDQLVQLGHAVGAGPLETHNDRAVAVELAGLEGLEHFVLIGKATRRRLDQPALLIDRAGLEDPTAEIAGNQAHPAVALERLRRGAEHVDVGAFLGALPNQLVAVKLGIADPRVHRVRASRQCIGVEQAFSRQGVGHERHPTRILEVVHVLRAVGIDARDQRDRRR